MTYRLQLAAHVAVVLAIACTAVIATAVLPIANPYTAQGLRIVAGVIAGWAASELLPCPCPCHRKDHQP
jgi:ABC-type uncharacterized transport system permease subunit